MDADGGGDGGSDGDASGDVSEYWGLDWDVDAGGSEEDGVEQEPELEHDVSRSTH